MERIILSLYGNVIVRLVVIAVVMDTIFGVGRAIRERKFNSSVGIDGAIRKVSMVVSIVFLGAIDILVHINLIAFIPEEARSFIPGGAVGMAEFFGILYLCYEAVSILKNMTLCGLPVKGLWKKVQAFLTRYTKELPDTEEEDKKEEAPLPEGVEATDQVPPGATEQNQDGTYNTYDGAGNVTGKITAEQYEKYGKFEE